ncbi:putative zinc-binding oxidoreductase protein [Rosellinia necatrix]|uniref:Putative zinc-binding oxidoreductase protein n=1 Tax=Rosellinia necatrix TaxID=77044 RepID=A0A1W2TWR5_ROSNE|nr:putative zinc-binding oxidoreductase protein [Rosellinia necatrix]
MPPTNRAAFYPSDKAPLLQVEESPYPDVGDDEIIIKVAAAAINPVDHKIQDLGTDVFPFLKYPLAGGLDVAGTVVTAGRNVTRFQAGDRVLSFPSDFATRAAGFQEYVAAPASMSALVPRGTPLVDAAVLPSGVATAAVALHQYLGLAYPTATSPAAAGGERESKGTLLVAGGASAVGSNAIQLGVAAGYEVIATASRKNFAHCAALGASAVFDYGEAGVAGALRDALRGRRCVGAFSAQEGANALVFDVMATADVAGGSARRVACAILFGPDGVPAGVAAEMVHAYWIKDTPLADAVFGSFLPAALASGRYRCEPRPRVVGHGLESVQAAFDIGKTYTVSCEKLVVTLSGET